MPKHAERIGRGKQAEPRGRRIARTVVDHDDLEIHGPGLAAEGLEHLEERVRTLESRDDDGEVRRHTKI